MVVRVVYSDGLRLYFGTTLERCTSYVSKYLSDGRVSSVTISRTDIKE